MHHPGQVPEFRRAAAAKKGEPGRDVEAVVGKDAPESAAGSGGHKDVYVGYLDKWDCGPGTAFSKRRYYNSPSLSRHRANSPL